MPVRRISPALAALAAASIAGTAHGQSQFEVNQQAGSQYKAADKALNATYAKLVAQASSGGKSRLRAAQRAWLKFRDSDCTAFAGSRGGSAYPMEFSLCLAARTQARTKQLQAEIDCQEGDLSCGGFKQD